MSQINESAIKTPGVFVNEIPSFAPSIAQVATAIPAFIGYTQMAVDANGNPVTNQAVRISSLIEYVKYFGKGYEDLQAVVTLNKSDNSIKSVSVQSVFAALPAVGGTYTASAAYQMFNSIQMFFANGGADCYIISIGSYFYKGFTPSVGVSSAAAPALKDFISAGSILCFEVLRKEDEPTLIVIPDAVMLPQNDFNTVMTTALKQCGDLQDRFAIIDVLNGDQDRTFNSTDVITVFRTGIGGSNLNYGAAYYPWLSTSLPVNFSFGNIQVLQYDSTVTPATTTYEPLSSLFPTNALITQITNAIADQTTTLKFINDSTKFRSAVPAVNTYADLVTAVTAMENNITNFVALGTTPFKDKAAAIQNGLTVQSIFDGYVTPNAQQTPLENLMSQLKSIADNYAIPPNGAITLSGPFTALIASYTLVNNAAIYGTPVPTTDQAAIDFIRPIFTAAFNGTVTMVSDFLKNVSNLINGLELQIIATVPTYANIKNAALNQGIVVPPSGAIAGIYATVDGSRGVWKAPANLSLNSVIAPVVKINNDLQEDLNIDTNAGKSINAIRAFTGKGILVWGARTLDGNSNDFKYISVRRFYIMVEESARKAANAFVFEPNDGNTWVKIRAMIENYLTNLWRLGALAGSKPEQAFYVKVGLGQTMTFDDILNGRMIVEIGMAPVRPAEFIILRFSQIQQQS
jgi:phage tail sheath protein FI